MVLTSISVATAFIVVSPADAKPVAAEFRRWEGTGTCTGDYSVLSRDNMDECTPFHLPAPASIWIEQKNDTSYSSYHFQGPTDCSGTEGTLVSDWIVGECFDYGDYSQMRVWITAPAPPTPPTPPPPPPPAPPAPPVVKAVAAEFRRWEGTGTCTGDYSVLSHDNMDECTPFHLPAPASIWIEQKNDTAYSSYHFQGPTDCSGTEGTLVSDWIVGECFDYGDYSQMRVWITAPAPPTPPPPPPPAPPAPPVVKAVAAEFRRWEGTGACTGDYSVLSRDNMDECTPFHVPAPASIWIEQKNDTAYSSYHFQGPTDCSGTEGTLVSDWIVGECFDYGDYSQKRVWITQDEGALQI